jgi:hypothetical protein
MRTGTKRLHNVVVLEFMSAPAQPLSPISPISRSTTMRRRNAASGSAGTLMVASHDRAEGATAAHKLQRATAPVGRSITYECENCVQPMNGTNRRSPSLSMLRR